MNLQNNYPTITLHNFGPISDFHFSIRKFNILTGPQAGGKSTVAKSVLFCHTVKNELVTQLTLPLDESRYHLPARMGIKKRLRNKFLRTFGSTWSMSSDMRIVYEYCPDISVTICLVDDKDHPGKNFVEFIFSDKIRDFLSVKERESYPDVESIILFHKEADQLFNDYYDSIYIPAGRGMITLLTDQLNYIFSSSNDVIPSTIDHCTRQYVEKILQLRPLFTGGLQGLLEDKLHLTQEIIDKEKAYLLLDLASRVLKGQYYYSSGEERLSISDDRFVKINYASSGQQEAVWIFNLLFYYLLNKKQVFLILEEPEAHLFPEAQLNIAKALGLFQEVQNRVLVTTHSPYLLGAFNNMLYADKIPEDKLLKTTSMRPEYVLHPSETTAYYMDDGAISDAMDHGLIQNELIDNASEMINTENDQLMNLFWKGNQNE